VEFDPRFRASSVARNWREPVRIDYGGRAEYLNRFEVGGVKELVTALCAIDALPIPGEPMQSDRRAYQATGNGNYFGFDKRLPVITLELPKEKVDSSAYASIILES
jgi:hypothetical protein